MGSEREQLRRIIEQWNENRLDLFSLSEPNEELEFHGVMRFYFAESGQRVATKCLRVSSTATTRAVISALVEKFHPDLRMLTTPVYSLWEVHENGEERRLAADEKPLLVQLNWHKDDREGRFLMKREGDEPFPLHQIQNEQEPQSMKRKLSKREKKEQKKKEKEIQARAIREAEDIAAQKLYSEVPQTSFTRTISNPEIVMKKRRERKLEQRLKEMGENPQAAGGSLKIYGQSLSESKPYVTLLVSIKDTAFKIVKETLDKYGLEKEDASQFCLVEVLSHAIDNNENITSDETISLNETVLENEEFPLQILTRQPPNKDGSAVAGEPRVYWLQPNVTEVGSDRALSTAPQAITLYGPYVHPRHCAITFRDQVVTVTPCTPNAEVQINGHPVVDTAILRNGFTLRIGRSHFFRVCERGGSEKTPVPHVLPMRLSSTSSEISVVPSSPMAVNNNSGELPNHSLGGRNQGESQQASRLAAGVGDMLCYSEQSHFSQRPSLLRPPSVHSAPLLLYDGGDAEVFETTFDIDGRIETISLAGDMTPRAVTPSASRSVTPVAVAVDHRHFSPVGFGQATAPPVQSKENDARRPRSLSASAAAGRRQRRADQAVSMVPDVPACYRDSAEHRQVHGFLRSISPFLSSSAVSSAEDDRKSKAQIPSVYQIPIRVEHSSEQRMPTANERNQASAARANEDLVRPQPKPRVSLFTGPAGTLNLNNTVQFVHPNAASQPFTVEKTRPQPQQQQPQLQQASSLSMMTDTIPAIIELNEAAEDAFMTAVIRDTDASTLLFKLAPAYVLYMTARYRISAHYRGGLYANERAARLSALLSRVTDMLHVTIQDHCHDVGSAFWMANCSELLNFLKSDRDLCDATFPEPQESLADAVQKAFGHLAACLRQDLHQTLPALLDQTLDDDSASKPCLRMLSSAMLLLRQCKANAALTIQLFSQLFHHLNMALFNWLMSPDGSDYCCRSWGSQINRRLSGILAWAEKQGLELAASCHLSRFMLAAQLLEARKASLDDLASLSSACVKLNSLQLRRLLERYRPEPGVEPPIPHELIESLVKFAESSADENARSDGRTVTLEEEAELRLPFLLPEDGYSADVVKGIPPGLQEFVEKLLQKGVCRMVLQPSFAQSWNVYFATSSEDETGSNFGQPPTIPLQHNVGGSPTTPQPEIAVVAFSRGKSGIGLSIVAAQGSVQRQLGIYVKKIVKDSIAERDGRIKAGDQLLSVNDVSLVGIGQEQAAEIMARSGPNVRFEVAKQAAVLNGLSFLLNQPSPPVSQKIIMTPPALTGIGQAPIRVKSEELLNGGMLNNHAAGVNIPIQHLQQQSGQHHRSTPIITTNHRFPSQPHLGNGGLPPDAANAQQYSPHVFANGHLLNNSSNTLHGGPNGTVAMPPNYNGYSASPQQQLHQQQQQQQYPAYNNAANVRQSTSSQQPPQQQTHNRSLSTSNLREDHRVSHSSQARGAANGSSHPPVAQSALYNAAQHVNPQARSHGTLPRDFNPQQMEQMGLAQQMPGYLHGSAGSDVSYQNFAKYPTKAVPQQQYPSYSSHSTQQQGRPASALLNASSSTNLPSTPQQYYAQQQQPPTNGQVLVHPVQVQQQRTSLPYSPASTSSGSGAGRIPVRPDANGAYNSAGSGVQSQGRIPVLPMNNHLPSMVMQNQQNLRAYQASPAPKAAHSSDFPNANPAMPLTAAMLHQQQQRDRSISSPNVNHNVFGSPLPFMAPVRGRPNGPSLHDSAPVYRAPQQTQPSISPSSIASSSLQQLQPQNNAPPPYHHRLSQQDPSQAMNRQPQSPHILTPISPTTPTSPPFSADFQQPQQFFPPGVYQRQPIADDDGFYQNGNCNGSAKFIHSSYPAQRSTSSTTDINAAQTAVNGLARPASLLPQRSQVPYVPPSTGNANFGAYGDASAQKTHSPSSSQQSQEISPWEKEERDRIREQIMREVQDLRDAEIEALESKENLSEAEEDRLRALKLEQEFQRRLREASLEDDAEETSIVPASLPMAELAKVVHEDLERRNASYAEQRKEIENQERQAAEERNYAQREAMREKYMAEAEEKYRRLAEEQRNRREQEKREQEQIAEAVAADRARRELEEKQRKEREFAEMQRRMDSLSMMKSAATTKPPLTNGYGNAGLAAGAPQVPPKRVQFHTDTASAENYPVSSTQHSFAQRHQPQRSLSPQQLSSGIPFIESSGDDFSHFDGRQPKYNFVPEATPKVIGAQEVYRDPRDKLKQQRFISATGSSSVEGEKLSFNEKMKLFAKTAGEQTPKDRLKISSAQREIEVNMVPPQPI